jgi:polysaccharide export outer membrane protein
MRLALWALLATPLFQAGSASAQVEYEVGSKDVLTIVVWGLPELSGKFEVDAEGTVQLPLVGRVKVGDLTVREIEDELKKRLLDGYVKNPQVTATVESYRSQQVFVQGEVRQPGSYPLSGATTLLEVLTRAGSVTPDAGDEVVITRQTVASKGTPPSAVPAAGGSAAPEVRRISLTDLQSGSVTENIVLQDGDTILVPAGEKVYITGHVRSPNAYTIRKNTTVLQALALAGGPTERAATNRTKIRRLIDGKPKEIAAKPDDIVQPGDTIIVPERYF